MWGKKKTHHAKMSTDEVVRGKRLFGIALAAGDAAAFQRLVPAPLRDEVEAKHPALVFAPPDNALMKRAALDLIADGLSGLVGVGPLMAAHVFLECWSGVSWEPDLSAERQAVNAWLRSRGVDAEIAPPTSSN